MVTCDTVLAPTTADALIDTIPDTTIPPPRYTLLAHVPCSQSAASLLCRTGDSSAHSRCSNTGAARSLPSRYQRSPRQQSSGVLLPHSSQGRTRPRSRLRLRSWRVLRRSFTSRMGNTTRCVYIPTHSLLLSTPATAANNGGGGKTGNARKLRPPLGR